MIKKFTTRFPDSPYYAAAAVCAIPFVSMAVFVALEVKDCIRTND